MIETGLPIQDFDEAYKMLCMLNETAMNSRDALKEFLDIHKAPENYFSLAEKVVYNSPPDEYHASPTDNALEVIKDISTRHQLALVTVGNEEIQRSKLKKAGINPALFTKIFICPEKDKKPYYEALLQDLSFSLSEVIVCGDRISVDLTPAKELGFKTVHIRFGRGLGFTGLKRDVDYTILHLRELTTIVKRFEAKEKIALRKSFN